MIQLTEIKKEKQGDYSETITKGEKWGIKIGSSHAEVYAQLQKAGPTLDFQNVAIFGHKPYSSPESLGQLFPYYYALTIYNNTGTLDRVVLLFSGAKVQQIATGGGTGTSIASLDFRPGNSPGDRTRVVRGG